MEGAAAIEVVGASKVYAGRRGTPARRALDGVSLRVGAGEWTALLGPNGSGKSTLVRGITGAGSLDEGVVRLFGVEAAGEGRRAAAARLGVVFQSPGLDQLLTVRENLLAAAAVYGLVGERARRRVEELASALGIAERLESRVSTLSGGLARRADLARALLHEPDLLILDEATAGLDLQARGAFFATLAALRRERAGRPLTIVMSTHLMDEAELADRVVMISSGRVVADGSPAELRARCGGRVVRVAGAATRLAKRMREAGLDVETGVNGELIGRVAEGHGERLEALAAELVREGVSFEVSTPTLGDAYLMMTGRGLEDEPE